MAKILSRIGLGLLGLALVQLCALPGLTYAGAALSRGLATATPTPVALALGVDADGSDTARAMVYGWLREQHGLRATPDAYLEEQAYYLAGEAARLHDTDQWPQWPGLRYAVGPAGGDWGRYWPGCAACAPGSVCLALAPGQAMATGAYPGLAAATQVGAAVVWRNGREYLAVVWPGPCPVD